MVLGILHLLDGVSPLAGALLVVEVNILDDIFWEKSLDILHFGAKKDWNPDLPNGYHELLHRFLRIRRRDFLELRVGLGCSLFERDNFGLQRAPEAIAIVEFVISQEDQ
jgi:hypothetical protein